MSLTRCGGRHCPATTTSVGTVILSVGLAAHAATRDGVKREMNQFKAYENRDRRIRKVLWGSGRTTYVARKSGELHSPGWASDHQLVEPSAQEFIPPVDAIVEGALNMLGKSAVTHACERRCDKTDRGPPRGNASGNVDGSAIKVPDLCGIETPPRFCSLPRARW